MAPPRGARSSARQLAMVTSPKHDLPLDPFERFAAECGIRMTAEVLYGAPRDVLHPPAESEQHYYITLWADRATAEPLRLVYDVSLAESAPPRLRDVLWWMAGDAWAIERAMRRLDQWAADHDYAVASPATARLFERHLQLVTAMTTLVSEEVYRRLLAIYAAQVTSPKTETP